MTDKKKMMTKKWFKREGKQALKEKNVLKLNWNFVLVLICTSNDWSIRRQVLESKVKQKRQSF